MLWTIFWLVMLAGGFELFMRSQMMFECDSLRRLVLKYSNNQNFNVLFTIAEAKESDNATPRIFILGGSQTLTTV